ncbi:unnamed protein product [Toxocara canis]|uniref:Uncharacterized protein n=1 Tax=Toxocara canis TaxID=6265 RepID=A0A183VEN1_TOXCA|nr:unnamed protein product [Toxocara canis]
MGTRWEWSSESTINRGCLNLTDKGVRINECEESTSLLPGSTTQVIDRKRQGGKFENVAGIDWHHMNSGLIHDTIEPLKYRSSFEAEKTE